MARLGLYSIAVRDPQTSKFVFLSDDNGKPKEWEEVNLQKALEKAIENHGDNNVMLFSRETYGVEMRVSLKSRT